MLLYEREDGKRVVTHSAAQTFLMCPREAYYKYALKLKPKKLSKPLTRGTWFHALLEAYYNGDDWQEIHRGYCLKFAQLFDEEKEDLGDLPAEMYSLMRAYLWHYKHEEITVKETELMLEHELPNGIVLRGKVDALVEDEYGLWIGDHKTHKKLPDWDHRALDQQHPYYIWLARKNGIPVRGFFWNYVRVDAISTPRVVKSGDRFYSDVFAGTTDYPTLVRAIRQAQEDYPEKFLRDGAEKAKVKKLLDQLKTRQYRPNQPQTSPHFRRDLLEPFEDQIERSIASLTRTADRMASYSIDDPDTIERSPINCKSFFCSYRDLSTADLVAGDSAVLQRTAYSRHDPMAYYGPGDSADL